jgi:NADH-quinone oxidoreductase subunit G
VAREATATLTGERVHALPLAPVEGLKGVRAGEVSAGGRTVRVAVVSGLGPARELMEALEAGTASYDIVEVMACPGGCTGGGGQPCPNGTLERVARARGLRGVDTRHEVRLARDNPLVADLYRKLLGSPNSEAAHAALHTEYGGRQRVHAARNGNGNGNCRVPHGNLVVAARAHPGSNGSGGG